MHLPREINITWAPNIVEIPLHLKKVIRIIATSTPATAAAAVQCPFILCQAVHSTHTHTHFLLRPRNPFSAAHTLPYDSSVRYIGTPLRVGEIVQSQNRAEFYAKQAQKPKI